MSGCFIARAKIFTIVFFDLVLASCAVQPGPLSNPAQYKTVAIISLLPQTYTMSYIGFTVFENHYAEFPLDFDPNLIVTQTATNLLSSHYQVRDLDLNAAAIINGVQQNYSTIDLNNTAPLVQAQLERLVKPGTVDLIVVIDGSDPEPVGNLSPTDSGVGLYTRSQFGGAGNSSGVIAPFELFDGRSFQQIALSYAGQMSGPASDLNWKGEPYDDLSASDKVALDEVGKRALAIYVTRSLSDVHLLN